ncbi:hypothetical protein HRG_006114 [Hirsutella rhossiliensis]
MALPDIVAWSQAREEARAQEVAQADADKDSDIDYNYISMMLSSEPDLSPHNSSDDDVQIVTTQRQPQRIRAPLSQFPLEQQPPLRRRRVQLNEKDEAELQAELEEERVIVRASDEEDEEDEPELVISGRRFCIPKSRER